MRALLPLASLLLAALILVFGNGVASLLIPARAALEGWSADVIALIGASYALAFTAGCVVVPRMVARVGHIRVFAALGTLTTASMLLHAMEPTAWFWIAVRGLAGFSIAGSYMILESWLNEQSTNDNRGLVFSAYMVVSLAGQAVGPFLVTLGDVGDFQLFAWGALIYTASTLPVTLAATRAPTPLTRVSLDLPALYRASPAAFVGSLMTGAVAGAWGSLVPVYGAGLGLTTVATATLIAAGTLGSVAFQLPLGRLSDRVDRRYVMVGVGAFGACAGLVLAAVPLAGWSLVGVAFLFGAALYTTYSLNVAHANDWAAGVSFVTVASGLLILYGIGSTVGPLVAGRAMAVAGPGALFAFTAACHVVYAGFALWRLTRRADVPDAEQTDFRALPTAGGATPQTYALDVRADAGGAEVWGEPDRAVAGGG